MKQQSLGLGQSSKRTRRCEFLGEMERVAPWGDLVPFGSLHLPEGMRGHYPLSEEAMLRVHFLQHWFNITDLAIEGAPQDVPLFREFADLGGWDDWLSDEATALRFRHVLEMHKLAPLTLESVNDWLPHKVPQLKTGTEGYATLIAAPITKKMAGCGFDPQKKQSKKRKQRYSGMNGSSGTDAVSWLVQTVRFAPDYVNDVVQANSLLQGRQTEACGDAGYQGTAKRGDAKSGGQWNFAMPPSKRRRLDLFK